MSILIAAMLMSAQAAPPAPAEAPAAPARPASDMPAFSADTAIEVLAAHAEARAVLARHLPNLFAHPAYEQFKGLSLRAVQPYSNGAITEAVLASIDAELRALR